MREFRPFGTDAEFLGRIDSLRCTAGCDNGPPLPEPGSLLLAAAGLAAGTLRPRRRTPRR